MATRKRPSKPDEPISLNLARIVHRLLTDPAGWRVDLLCEDLGIAERTYRKYRRLLTQDFDPLKHSDGHPMVRQVRDEDGVYLRLVDSDFEQDHVEFDLCASLSSLEMARCLYDKSLDEVGSKTKSPEYIISLKRLAAASGLELSALINSDRMLLHQPSGRKDYSNYRATLQLLAGALVNHQVIEAVVVGDDGETVGHYNLEPLSLLDYDGELYLLARCREKQSVISFAFQSLLDVLPLDERFQYPPVSEYDPNDHLDGSFGLKSSARVKSHKVKLLFAPDSDLHSELESRHWHPSQEFSEANDGRLRLSFQAQNLQNVARWLRTFGSDVEVLAPKALRDTLNQA